MTKIDFEFETEYGLFRDALVFPDDIELPSDQELEVLKQQRLQDWVYAITHPVPEEVIDQPPQE